MSDVEQMPAIPVHLASAGPGVQLGGGHAPRPRPRRRPLFRTVVLTADNPYVQLFGIDENRLCAYVQAGGNDAVLCSSKSQAQKPANISDATLAAPDGTLLPYGNAAPYPLETTEEVWVAAAAYPTQVTVTVITNAEAGQ
jgi:hypothetical protein